MKNNDIIELKISDLSYSGYAVGKIDNFAVFIHNAVPGDILKARIIKLKKNHAFAEITGIIEHSPLRVKHDCPYFEDGCGGCQWLNIDYKTQLDYKHKIINDAFKRIGKFECDINPVNGMVNPYNYRNKAVFQCDGKAIGFNKLSTNDIVPVKKCLQQMKHNQEAFDKIIFKDIKNLINVSLRCNAGGDIVIQLSADEAINSIASFDEVKQLKGIRFNNKTIKGETHLSQRILDADFDFPAEGFFQVNYQIAGEIADYILKNAEFEQNDMALDLYCGCGFFSILAARKCFFVQGIDNNKESVIYARNNARKNGLNNTDFSDLSSEKGIKRFLNKKIGKVILDPPRNGCEKNLIFDIIETGADTVIYISCAPDTLARDLALFLKGGYMIKTCQPFDMFPHTYHVETVVILTK